MTEASILIVEDEGIIAKDLSERLRSLGYSIAGIEVSGEGALSVAESERPDLVLMDIMLRGRLDGIEAADLIRATTGIPVIYLSALSDEKILERARATEPSGFMFKPFNDKELYFAIEMAIYKDRSERDIRRTRAQYLSLLESVDAIPWEMELSTNRFTFVGPQAERILGYPLKQWVDWEFFLSLMHHDDRINSARSSVESIGKAEDFEMECRMEAADGGWVWIRNIVSVLGAGETPRVLRGFMLDITRDKNAEKEREKLILELQDAITKIKTLRNLLPICAWCKKVRDDKGYWTQVETYLREHANTEFTHGICPECHVKVEKEFMEGRETESCGD